MQELFTLHNLLSLLGGVVGGFRAAVMSPPRPLHVRVSDFLVGVLFGIASSYLTPADAPILALAYGVIAGTLATYALDVIHDLLPKLIKMRLGVDTDKDNK